MIFHLVSRSLFSFAIFTVRCIIAATWKKLGKIKLQQKKETNSVAVCKRWKAL